MNQHRIVIQCKTNFGSFVSGQVEDLGPYSPFLNGRKPNKQSSTLWILIKRITCTICSPTHCETLNGSKGFEHFPSLGWSLQNSNIIFRILFSLAYNGVKIIIMYLLYLQVEGVDISAILLQ